MSEQSYLRAKVEEYSIILKRLDRELSRLGRLRDHPQVITYLRRELDNAERQRSTLRRLLSTGLSTTPTRSATIVRDIEYSLQLMLYYYLPALQAETVVGARWANVLKDASSRLGLGWIEDVMVRMDSPLAIVSQEPGVPLLFMPPPQGLSLLELPGLYHELGHNVYFGHPTLKDALDQARIRHFTDQLGLGGSMSPSQRDQRNQAINRAAQYWSFEALAEIFCDIFATLCCGPSHYTSMIDLGFKMGSDPYRVNFLDEHPPMASRVYVCHQVLSEDHQKSSVVQAAERAWAAFVSRYRPQGDYKLVCAPELMDAYVQAVTDTLPAAIPSFSPFANSLENVASFGEQSFNVDMEVLLNRAVQVIFEQPERYADWEHRALEALGFTDD